MKREDIEKAAFAHMEKEYAECEYPVAIADIRLQCVSDFKAGADWHMNSVWHDDKERPVPMKECIVFLCAPRRMGWHIGRIEEQGGNKGKWNIYGYFTPASHNEVKGWAYIEDLLPDAE